MSQHYRRPAADPAVIAIIVLGLLSLVPIFYIHNISAHIVYEQETLSNSLRTANVKVATSHLWLEEYLAGDTTIEIDKVLAMQDEAVSLIDQTISSEFGDVYKDLTAELSHLEGLIVRFRKLAGERVGNIGRSGIGSEIDQRFDALFKQVQGAFDMVSASSSRHIYDELRKQEIIQYTVIFLWILLVTGAGAIVFRHSSKRAQAEKEIAEKTAYLDNILRSSIDMAIAAVDLDYVILYYNPVAEKIFGYTAEEAIGQSVLDIHLKEKVEPERFEKAIKIVREEGEYKYSVTQENEDGVRFVESRVSAIKDSDGEVIGYTLMSRDVTERKQAEDEIRDIKERYDYATEVGKIGAWDWNPSTGELKWTDEVYRIMGFSPGEITPTYELFLDMIHPDDRGQLNNAVNEAIEKKKPYMADCRVFSKDGHERECHAIGRVIFGDDVEPVRMYGTFQDITDRKKMEHSLLVSEMRFKGIFENAAAGAAISTADGRFIQVNEYLCKMLGYTKEELLQKTFMDITHPEDLKAEMAHYDKAMSGGVNEVTMEKRYIHKNGKSVRILISVSIMKAQSGEPEYFIAVIQDITEQKRAEEERNKLERQVQQAQKLESLGVLAGGIAHDFNNLLTSILGNADMALDELSAVSPAHDTIKEIVTASKRASELSRQMLAYSGKGKFVIKVINLNEVVSEMMHLLEVSISKKATLKFRFDDNLPLIEADVTQMRQVIMNLIINASEALGEEDGVISVTTGSELCDRAYFDETYLTGEVPEGKYVHVEVSDTGVGMDKETMQNIFDPFFTTKFTGRGLGMSAVLGIVRGHKGAIKVYSEEGQGTTFKVMFPQSEKGAASQAENGASSGKGWKGKGTVLIVDDEETIRILGVRMLGRFGLSVVQATDGVEAVEIFTERADEISLILLDLTMPRMGGEECFKKLRQIKKDVPIIMTSGYNEQEVTQRFIGKGLAGFVQKPFQMETMRNAVRSVLEEGS